MKERILKKGFRRILSIVVMTAMVLTLVPSISVEVKAATSGTIGTDINWKIENGVLSITGTGEMPDYDGEYNGAPWASNKNSITKIEISEGITKIGNYAFKGCENLTEVSAPNVTQIGTYAFKECRNLTDVDIPKVKTLGEHAFDECYNLNKFTSTVLTTLGQYSFGNCFKLSGIDLSNVTTIEQFAFYKVNFESKTTGWSIDLSKVTSIGVNAFQKCYFDSVNIGKNIPTLLSDVFKDVGSSNGGVNNPVLKLPFGYSDVPQDSGDNVYWKSGYFRYTPATATISSVTLDETSTTLLIGDKKTLTATVVAEPDEESAKTVTWSSDDASVATVNATTGEIEAVAEGTATITATSTVDSTKSASCTVTVHSILVISGDTATYSGTYSKTDTLKYDVVEDTLGDFYGSKIVIEDFNKIGDNAFVACQKKYLRNSIELRDVTEVGSNGLQGFYNVSNLSIDSVTTIGEQGFAGINRTGDTPMTLNMPNIVSIGIRAFEDGKFASVTIGKNCEIADNAFSGVGVGCPEEDRPVLKLPADWTGDVPDADGNWKGGKFKYIPAPKPAPDPKPSNDTSSDSEPTKVFVDLDTNKSEVAYGTVFMHNKDNVRNIFDMKVHSVDARTKGNQEFLAASYAKNQGKRARVLITTGIYPRNKLYAKDLGDKKFLSFVNLEKKVQPVYAVCYNQTDKAYYLTGTMNANGTAVFPDFIARDATNITIFVLE